MVNNIGCEFYQEKRKKEKFLEHLGTQHMRYYWSYLTRDVICLYEDCVCCFCIQSFFGYGRVVELEPKFRFGLVTLFNPHSTRHGAIVIINRHQLQFFE